jgi:hypothetical protein
MGNVARLLHRARDKPAGQGTRQLYATCSLLGICMQKACDFLSQDHDWTPKDLPSPS